MLDQNKSWKHRDLSHFRSATGDDLFAVHGHFARWLEEAEPGGYYLYALPARSAPSREISLSHPHFADRELINLASYNYLGLAQRPEVIEAGIAALRHFGLGAAGSPRLSGMLEVHAELEQALARFFEVESVVLFPTGYGANVGVISSLVGPGDVVVADISAHASIVDGCALSRAKLTMFRHNDPVSLARKLEDAGPRALVVVEGVYSMDGDRAPLREIVEVCRQHGARLLVDEAHSSFVFGAHGRGLAEHEGVEADVDVHLGTLSKALGGVGGYVAGSRELTNYLRAYSRSLVFSCALPPALAAGLLAALNLAIAEPQLRTKLWSNVEVMRAALVRQGIDIGESTSQVIPIMINDDERIFAVTEDLLRAGVYLNPIRYPAVKRNRSRLRVSVTAAHEPSTLEHAAEVLGRVLREHGVIA